MCDVRNATAVYRVSLKHARAPIADVRTRVTEELQCLNAMIKPEMRIAIACGSRGISNIAAIAEAVVAYCKSAGAQPFIIPAMGSHGGATAQGQARVLSDYGICEETVHAPVRATMEVMKIGTACCDENEVPVYMDRYAWEADGVIVLNRVKAHTDFHGSHESGIVKMLTIGLGKHAQAIAIHKFGTKGLRDYIPFISQKVIESGKILGALAILEDGYDQTADIQFAKPEEIFLKDREMLERSRTMMARLPFEHIHTLMIGQMGKNISGTGMDTNVVGRLRIEGEANGKPTCDKIIVCDLTEESHGNALGVGIADFTTRRLADKINWRATNENVVTSGFLQRGFLPIVAENDREAFNLALRTESAVASDKIQIVWIRDTLHLDTIYVTGNMIDELPPDTFVEKVADEYSEVFDENGALKLFCAQLRQEEDK